MLRLKSIFGYIFGHSSIVSCAFDSDRRCIIMTHEFISVDGSCRKRRSTNECGRVAFTIIYCTRYSVDTTGYGLGCYIIRFIPYARSSFFECKNNEKYVIRFSNEPLARKRHLHNNTRVRACTCCMCVVSILYNAGMDGKRRENLHFIPSRRTRKRKTSSARSGIPLACMHTYVIICAAARFRLRGSIGSNFGGAREAR